MPCPNCNSINITYAGKYKNGNGLLKHRMLCKDCKSNFILRTPMYKKKIPLKVRNKIIQLSKTDKGFIGKYDGLKKKTYSTREISSIVGVSKSYVFDIIKGK